MTSNCSYPLPSENHPDAIVYCQCSNSLLQHAVETFKGKEPAPLYAEVGGTKTMLPPMPLPGQVEFIYGGRLARLVIKHCLYNVAVGPPCQSFSRMNHHKDPVSSLIASRTCGLKRSCRMTSGTLYLTSCAVHYSLFMSKLIRSTLIANMISYVEFYRPSYFLLENVEGLLHHKLSDISMGIVKFVLRSLTSLG